MPPKRIEVIALTNGKHTYCSAVLHGTLSQPNINGLNLMHQTLSLFLL